MLSTRLALRSNIPLADFTTWRVGGPAQWLLEPASVDETLEALQWAQQEHLPCRVIGAGSNLLIHDDGLPGLTLSLRKLQGATLNADNGVVEALAGEPIPTLARRAARAGLNGLAWSVGIPGTVGGAAVMNAGAQGGCTADWLESVRVAPLVGGESFELNRDELDFDYRHSRLQDEELVVLSARFRAFAPCIAVHLVEIGLQDTAGLGIGRGLSQQFEYVIERHVRQPPPAEPAFQDFAIHIAGIVVQRHRHEAGIDSRLSPPARAPG